MVWLGGNYGCADLRCSALHRRLSGCLPIVMLLGNGRLLMVLLLPRCCCSNVTRSVQLPGATGLQAQIAIQIHGLLPRHRLKPLQCHRLSLHSWCLYCCASNNRWAAVLLLLWCVGCSRRWTEASSCWSCNCLLVLLLLLLLRRLVHNRHLCKLPRQR